MLQEAELYESQGLYAHALEIYRAVLTKDPKNDQAQGNLSRLQTSQGKSDTVATPSGDLTPRVALDLGQAYMGMKLYPEALEEFTKGLKSSPGFRTELLQQIATCLIHLGKFDEGFKITGQILADRTLNEAEKGQIISDTTTMYLERGLLQEAHELLAMVSDERKKFVPGFDEIRDQVLALTRADVEVLVEDDETGEVYKAEPVAPAQPDVHEDLPEKGAALQRPAEVTPSPAAPPAAPAGETKAQRGRKSPPPTRSRKEAVEQLGQEVSTTILFACKCGKVHSARKELIGSKNKCGACGLELVVPSDSARRDTLSEQVLGKTVGGCRILYRIGGGGMGGVFKAHHVALDLPVAVKILHSHLADRDPVFIKRFIREARSTAKLQHPNVVGIMNVGFENGLHYIVMPYVGGGSAATLLERHGKLPVDQVLHIALQIAKALTIAEANNIMHRDIKPANILFTEEGEAKLADLGLAKSYLDAADSGITQTGIACGTPLYFSPEQAKGAPNIDIRSDIYSLGITLYHLLEGSPPFTAESAYVIFQKHVHEELPPLRNAVPPVSEPVVGLLRKMTEKKPEERFESARQLEQAISDVQHGLVSTGKTSVKKGLLERIGITRVS